MLVALRIFYCLQLMNIFLKMDNFIHSEWKELFWPFWIIFSILIGLSFTIFLILITKLCTLCCVNSEKTECKIFLVILISYWGSLAILLC